MKLMCNTYCSLIVFLLLFSAVWPAMATGASDQTFAVNLSRDERLLLEQVVCGQKYGVAVAEIDARAFDASASKANYADVKCRPHAQIKDKPLYYVAQCARASNQWSCGPAELETRVTLRERELVMRPGTVEPKRAYEAIQKISTYGYFQAKSLDAALQSTCNMGVGDKPDLIEISCQHWSITVSFWCPKTTIKTACPRVIFMGKHF
jgi:hypothetical protein